MRAADRPYFADPPLAFAHRGGAAHPGHEGIENTLAAFRAAVRLGYRHVETDVHLTRDGVLVAAHDATLDRVAGSDGASGAVGHGASGAIAELTWEELRQVLVGGRERMPLFAELLDALPGVFVNVDLKARGTPAALARVLRERDAEARVCVGSFSSPRLWLFRLLTRGRVATSAGPLGVAALRLLPRALSRLVHSPGLAFQVPTRYRLFGREIEVVTPGFVAAAHAIGRQVHVWTIDDPTEMERLLDLGVDGIVTDRLDALADVFARRGLPLH